MSKVILAIMATLFTGSLAAAACNPCICGSGGGAPPPTDCPKGGKWRNHSHIPVRAQGLLYSILSDKMVEQQLLSAGGLEAVSTIESGSSVSFKLKTSDGAEFVTPNFQTQD
ncbi:hypothetical protein EZJ49_07455 [Bdellovibrio bacteriovorus]|uniref:hypothetical protein n=1 Tax=Bdellovibrio bacteriovorus TaxID=959 RepID=UPI0021CE4088|nr:hypothetical protein [Bdellovibrio bacteriovorus]UXR66084.1 hypothetical protein EZJ49_07455 [Bdellovibrio bacteriovorus]